MGSRGAPRAIPADADVVGLYLLLALALLAPLASNDVLPEAIDHANHTAVVVEAKLALDEGQFPLRVAPYASEGLRYPLFQFYAQTPYLLAGGLHKFVTTNPWRAIKLTYLAGLCLAGLFVYRLGQLLGFDRVTSTLAGVVYIAAPYLLINMHARGAFTEAVAQLLLPPVAYASARVAVRSSPAAIVWASVAWALLGMSHIITFLYATCFYGLLVAGLAATRQVTLRDAALLVVPCALGWSLSAFAWYPAVTTTLQVHSMIGDVFYFRWITPLSALMSFTSLPPEPIGRPGITRFLNPAVGAPILIAAAGLGYFAIRGGVAYRGVWLSMVLFVVAFVCVWSPVNFWQFLPAPLLVAQFSYRFLTFTTVFGTMLFAYFLWVYRERYGPPVFVGWLIGILLLAQSYLPVMPQNVRTLASIVAAPGLSVATEAYEIPADAPLGAPESRLVPMEEVRRQCGLDGAVLKCTVNFDAPAAVQLPMLFYPSLLRITVDRQPVAYHGSRQGSRALATVTVAAGRHRIAASFRGSAVGNGISAATIPLLAVLWLWRRRARRLRLATRSGYSATALEAARAGR